MPYKDPEKQRQAGKDWYKRNKTTRIAQIRAREKEIIEWYKEYKSTLKCSRCPENHPACIQFHHNGIEKKLHNIANVRAFGSLKKLKEEIAKCDVLCANCHAKEHYAPVA